MRHSSNGLRLLLLGMPGSPWGQTLAVRSLTRMFTEDPRIEVVGIDALAPIPTGLDEEPFDIIVLSPTFLAARFSPELLSATQSKFSFLQSSTALKVAMPQDDYDCAFILDNWLSEWQIDLVYTVCPHNWDLLYPRLHQTGRLRLGYTGYILDSELRELGTTKDWEGRSIDVSYRTSQLPPNFGELGYLKSEIVNLFRQKLPAKNELILDMSTHAKNRITGNAWYSFLENSRFVLVSPSGSSLIDPFGDLRQEVQTAPLKSMKPDEFLSSIEGLRFIECENTMLSPRNIEACLLGTTQVAITAEYSGILQPNVHYIPLDTSLDIAARIRDKHGWSIMRRSAFEAILSFSHLRASNFVGELIRNTANGPDRFLPLSDTLNKRARCRRGGLQKRATIRAIQYWSMRRLRDQLETGFSLLRSAFWRNRQSSGQ